MWLKVHKRLWALGGPSFWDELPGRLPLLGKRFRDMGSPGCKKVSLCHLYEEHSVEKKPASLIVRCAVGIEKLRHSAGFLNPHLGEVPVDRWPKTPN